MTSHSISTDKATFWLDNAGIVHFVCQPGVIVDVADLHQNQRLLPAICQGQPRPFLCKGGPVQSITREARTLAASPIQMALTAAVAVMIESPITQVIGNIFVTFSRPPYPVRLFTNEAEALAWLRPFASRPCPAPCRSLTG